MMKLILAAVALAICITFRSANSGPVPAPGGLVYPWTNWLALKAPPPIAFSPFFQPPVAPAAPGSALAAPDAADAETSPEAFANYLIARSILPAAPEKKKKDKKKDSSKEETDVTTKIPLIEVGDFWVPPTVAPNVTSPLVADPAYWAAKKTMFISKLFAALAKQVLNSTGTVTTTTPSPDAALLNEIDTVLLSDVARSLTEESPDVPPPTPKELVAAMKKEAKKQAKAEKKAKTKATKAKGPPAFVLAKKKPTPAAPTAAAPTPATESEEVTARPTLDYAALAKALLS